MTRRRKFTKEFKLNTVELSYQRENSKELAVELNIRVERLYRWHSEFATLESGSFPGNGRKKMTEEESELDRLRNELADVRMERDILKKAVGIFSKSDGRYSNS